jgi:hypothetical protein
MLLPWTTMRLCPLLCKIMLREATVEVLARALRATDEPALWAALLRVMAIQGQNDLVLNEVADLQPPDPRAAIGAFTDIGRNLPPELRSLAPQTAQAADEVAAIPRPTAYTLL